MGAAAVTVIVIVGILVVTIGFSSALPAIFSGIVFTIILALYWLRTEKNGANDSKQGESMVHRTGDEFD
jgi:L-asparagine transporter-like permease